jgi:hypothetical protein
VAGFSEINKELVHDVEKYFEMKIPILCEMDRDEPGGFASSSSSSSHHSL